MTSEHTAYEPQSATAFGTGFTAPPPAALADGTAPLHAGARPGSASQRASAYEAMLPTGVADTDRHGLLMPGQAAPGSPQHAVFPTRSMPSPGESDLMRDPDQTSAEEQADALLRESSLGQPGVLEISRRTSEEEAAEIMRRLRTRRNPSQFPVEEPPPEYAFENWVDQSRQLPHALMTAGLSYARQHFNHRAELCFRAALKAGHPDAETALAALPRDEDGMVLVGEDRPAQDADQTTDDLIAPIGQQTMNLMEEGLRLARSGSPGRARLAWSIGWALDMKAV